MIKAIIFDVFGTLIRITSGHSSGIIRQYITDCGNDVNEKEFQKQWRDFYKKATDADSSFETERNIFIARVRMFYDKYNVCRNAESDVDLLLSSACERKAYPDVLPALGKLKKKYKIYIGSNTDNDILDSVLKKSGITADGIFTSENLRCYKPNIDFYRHILEKTELNASEAVFIGDSIIDDVYGPQQLGIMTILIDRNGTYNFEIKPDKIFNHIPLSL